MSVLRMASFVRLIMLSRCGLLSNAHLHSHQTVSLFVNRGAESH